MRGDRGEHSGAFVPAASTGMGRATEIDQTIYHLWLVVEGKIQETWTFAEKAQALEAASVEG